MTPPRANRRLVTPPYRFPVNAGYASTSSFRRYVAPVAADPNPHLVAPGLDAPFLYHAGTARNVFRPTLTIDTTQDAAIDLFSFHYRPCPGREWGKAGTLPRVPRAVVVVLENIATYTAVADGIEAAAFSKKASVVVSEPAWGQGAALTDFCPPNMDVDNIISSNVWSFGLVDPAAWAGGELLFVTGYPFGYFSVMGGLTQDPSTANGYEKYLLTRFSTVPYYLSLNRNMAVATTAALPAVMARFDRFAGLYLYDSGWMYSPGNPADVVFSDLNAAYQQATFYGDVLGGFPEWSQQDVSFYLGDPSINAVIAAVNAAIAAFWT